MEKHTYEPRKVFGKTKWPELPGKAKFYEKNANILLSRIKNSLKGDKITCPEKISQMKIS